MKKNKGFIKDDDGIIRPHNIPKSFNSDYVAYITKYMNCLEPLFKEAQEKDDFQFILTLLRVRGVEDAGWDSFNNTRKNFDNIMDLYKKLDGDGGRNLLLWLYGHIVEASEPYELIANLLNICNGEGYRAFNFPKRKTKWGYRNQYPKEKIEYLKKIAKKVKKQKSLEPIQDVLNTDIRNAVFHSDYSVYQGELRLNDSSNGFPRIYNSSELTSILNKSMAYYEVVRNLIDSFKASYDESEVISTSLSFSRNPNERAVVIVREDHGVIAMKSAWNKEEIKRGAIDWFIGNIYNYEMKMINKGIYNLPQNRVERWNKFLRIFPKFISNRLVPIINKYV